MLTSKKRAFAKAWITCLNRTQAAKEAGYSPKTAYSQGSDLLKEPEVQAYIAQLQDELQIMPDIADAEEVLRGYTRDIRFDPGKLFDEDGQPKDIQDLDDDTRLALAGLKVKVREIGQNPPVILRTYEYKFPDKRATRETMAKHLGWVAPEKKELTGPGGEPLEGGIFEIILVEAEDGREKP